MCIYSAGKRIPTRLLDAIRFLGFYMQVTVQENKPYFGYWCHYEASKRKGILLWLVIILPGCRGFWRTMKSWSRSKSGFRGRMIRYFKLYIVSLAAFFTIDMLWLGVVARSLYQQQLGFLMTTSPNWFVAIVFYLLFILGLLVFVVLPGLGANSLKTTLLRATLFGLITYATYDLTNLATLKDWPALLSVVDLIWGTILSVLVSYISFMAGKRFVYYDNQ
jgi:uncharacterized membrane protein